MLYKILLFIFSFLFAFDVQVTSPIVLLMNGHTGKVLYEKNGYAKTYPASVTKMATAYYLISKEKELDKIITAVPDLLKTVSEEEKRSKNYPSYILESDGSSLHLQPFEKASYRSFLYALMLASANDVANVIAYNLEGSLEKFSDNLNLFLKNIGCKNTHFTNPHGLHDSEHFTTAYDMALLAKTALANPVFYNVVNTTKYFFPKTNKKSGRELTQTNQLLKPGSFFYPFAVGGKTGYHKMAKYNLVAAAKKNDRYLIAVIFHSANKDIRYKEAIRLFDHAFEENKLEKPLFEKGKTFSFEIDGALYSLKTTLTKDLIVSYYPSDVKFLKAKIHWKNLHLPISKNEPVAELKITDEEENLLLKEELLSDKKVIRTPVKFLKDLLRL